MGGNKIGFLDVLRPDWLLLSFVPFLWLKHPGIINGGGRTWMICMALKLILTTFAVFASLEKLAAIEKVKMDTGTLMTMQLVGASCAVVGIGMMVKVSERAL
tara:strand:+ start:257 stop:562 length:306 start_codon:yes stop_codon:yes gene_type:complete